MTTPHQDIQRILREEADRYDRILELVEREHDLLKSHRTEGLPAVVADKEALILEIRNLEEERQLVCLRLAKQCGVAPEQLRTETVADTADEAGAKALRALRGRLLATVERIGALNRQNRQMCENGMALVRDVMNAVAHASSPAPAASGGYPAAPSGGGGRPRASQAAGTRSWRA